MQIKRFEGRNVQEALKGVKETLGPEAIILSTRTVRRSPESPGPGNRSIVEVIAAIDQPYGPPAESLGITAPPASSRAGRGGERAETAGEEALFQRIVSAGLMPEFVQGFVREIQGLQRRYKSPDFPDLYRDRFRMRLMEAVDVTGPCHNGTKIWAFVGPTGVGKTTTLVKLAAHFSLKVTRRITLITLDTYRIGAAEQLKTCGQILNLPVEVGTHREKLRELIEKHSRQDLLLIDTAGKNFRHPGQMEELREFLTVHPHIESHLVLSATMKDRDMAQMASCFRSISIGSYIFTKIDETEEYVPIFNQLLRDQRPLSYLTCGQRVPEDIELATKARVSDLVINSIQWN